jgi:hypothetical protein
VQLLDTKESFLCNEQLQTTGCMSPKDERYRPNEADGRDLNGTEAEEIVMPGQPVKADADPSATARDVDLCPAEAGETEGAVTPSDGDSLDGSGPLVVPLADLIAMYTARVQNPLPEASPTPDGSSSSETSSQNQTLGQQPLLKPYGESPSWVGECYRDAKLLTPHKARTRYHRYELKREDKPAESQGIRSWLGSTDSQEDYGCIPKPEGLEDFRIVIEPTAWLKMSRLVAACEVEVAWSGFVRVEVVGETINLVVYDIFVPKQIGRPSTFDVSASGKAESFYSEFRTSRLSQAEVDQRMVDLKFHGHSHVWMGTYPSGTDNSFIRGVLERTKPLFYIRAIANKAGRLELTLYLLQYSLKISDIPWSIGWDQFSSIDEWAIHEVKSKVTREEMPLQPRFSWRAKKDPQSGSAGTEVPEPPPSSEPSDVVSGEPGATQPEAELKPMDTVVTDTDPSGAAESKSGPEEPQEPVVPPAPPEAPANPTLWEKLRNWWDTPLYF